MYHNKGKRNKEMKRGEKGDCEQRVFSDVIITTVEKGADVNAQGGICGNTLQAASYGVNSTSTKPADLKVS